MSECKLKMLLMTFWFCSAWIKIKRWGGGLLGWFSRMKFSKPHKLGFNAILLYRILNLCNKVAFSFFQIIYCYFVYPKQISKMLGLFSNSHEQTQRNCFHTIILSHLLKEYSFMQNAYSEVESFLYLVTYLTVCRSFLEAFWLD